MIRDYRLVVVLYARQQLPLEFEQLRMDIRSVVESLRGSLWALHTRGMFAVWEFSTYQPERYVRERLERLAPYPFKWYLVSENRVVYGKVTTRERDLLLEAIGFPGEKSA